MGEWKGEREGRKGMEGREGRKRDTSLRKGGLSVWLTFFYSFILFSQLERVLMSTLLTGDIKNINEHKMHT